MVTTRSYRQYCGVARALDLVGERWALLVVRELVIGPKRFTDLRRGLPGIATNVLTLRLKQLERDGIVERRTLPAPAASTVYELTGYGRDLVPIVLDLGRWGARSLGPRGSDQSLRSEWLAVAMQAFFRPEAAKGTSAVLRLRLPDGAFGLRIEGGELEVTPGAPAHADLTLTTDPDSLVGFLRGASVPPGSLSPEGDRALLARLPEIFAFGA